MKPRKCPVCRIGLVIRADVRTCSDQCAKIWRQLSWDEKQARLAKGYDDKVLSASEVEAWAKEAVNPNKEADSAPESIIQKNKEEFSDGDT